MLKSLKHSKDWKDSTFQKTEDWMIQKIQNIETFKRLIRIKILNGKIEKTGKIETLQRFKD